MRIDVLTLFPELFHGPLGCSLLKKARERGLLTVSLVDIRDSAYDKHRTADDEPYGGGPGMVLKAEPIYLAVESLRDVNSLEKIILMSPQGRLLTHDVVKELSTFEDMVVICGRYEEVDERVRSGLITDEISIGDYVLSGGELPALVLIESVSRLIPGVVGDEESVKTDSFYGGLLGYPQYTRPREFRGMRVPDILVSGNHELIKRWRLKESLRRTMEKRPGLLKRARTDELQKDLLAEIAAEG